MKKVLLAAAATALLASPAFAQSATVNINGNAQAVCSVSGSGTVNLGTDLATATGDLNAAAINNFTGATVTGYCTGVNSTATVSQTNFTRSPAVAAPSGFSTAVSFDAAVTLGLGTASSTGAAASVGLFNVTSQQIVLSNAAPTGGPTDKIVAGSYGASVTVTLAPLS